MSIFNYIEDDLSVQDYLDRYAKEEMITYKEIEHRDIVFSMFVHLKCMNCGMFRRNYHCLATPRWRKAKEILSKYSKFYLIYTRADNRERIKGLQRSNEDRKKEGRRTMNDWLVKKNACNANQSKTYHRIRRFLIQLKKRFPKKKMRLFGAGGGCTSCRKCGLVLPHYGKERKPCKRPNKSFGAPESWGIDVYGTLKKVGIDFDVIPEYDLINVGIIIIK